MANPTLTIPDSGFIYADDLYPVSKDNEQALIGSVLRGGRGAYERAREIVAAEMFWYTSHKSIWQSFESLYESGLQIDVIILGDEMERMKKMGEIETDWGAGGYSGFAYLSHLREEGDPRHAETYATRVQEYHFKRFLLQFSGKIGGWAANGRMPKDILADIYTELGKIELHGAEDQYTVSMNTVVSEVYDWTDAAANGKILGTPTGLTDLDNLLGTLINGNVYLVAARPGQGKTGLLLTIARNAVKNKKRVGVFSLEMSRLQVGQRLIAQESGIDIQDIIKGSLQNANEWARFTKAVEEVNKYSMIINDLSSINIAQIRQTARRMKRDGLDLLVVDYIQLASAENDKRYENRNLEVTAISRGLKYLANELDVPILAAAQLNRAVEARASKKPVLSDLRESGSLEQDAYVVIFLSETEDKNIVAVDVAKHRNGPVGECQLRINRPTVKFENLYRSLA